MPFWGLEGGGLALSGVCVVALGILLEWFVRLIVWVLYVCMFVCLYVCCLLSLTNRGWFVIFNQSAIPGPTKGLVRPVY